MKSFKQILFSSLQEKVMSTSENPNNPILKRLKAKGWDFVVLPPDADDAVPDKQASPEKFGYIAFGRCGVHRNGRFFIDGGTQGSLEGHPSTLKWGGYWGAREVKGKGRSAFVVEVRGRAGVDNNDIYAVAVDILDFVSRKLPKVK